MAGQPHIKLMSPEVLVQLPPKLKTLCSGQTCTYNVMRNDGRGFRSPHGPGIVFSSLSLTGLACSTVRRRYSTRNEQVEPDQSPFFSSSSDWILLPCPSLTDPTAAKSSAAFFLKLRGANVELCVVVVTANMVLLVGHGMPLRRVRLTTLLMWSCTSVWVINTVGRCYYSIAGAGSTADL